MNWVSFLHGNMKKFSRDLEVILKKVEKQFPPVGMDSCQSFRLILFNMKRYFLISSCHKNVHYDTLNGPSD